MAKKEYGKGFTLEDLQAQREAQLAMRRQVGLAMFPRDEPYRGPLWAAMERQDKPSVQFGEMASAAGRAGRAMQGMIDTLSAIGLDWPKPVLPGDPTPPPLSASYSSGEAVPVGFFGGLPVYEDANVPRGGGGFLVTDQPLGAGYRSTQIGWAKPAPPPEQPTGRFRNLDFEL